MCVLYEMKLDVGVHSLSRIEIVSHENILLLLVLFLSNTKRTYSFHDS